MPKSLTLKLEINLMSITWSGILARDGSVEDPSPVPRHNEPEPDDPEPDDETQDLVRPIKT